MLLIGASTGGPQALDQVCSGLGPVIDEIPILITQHMPPTFTTILAEHPRAGDRTPLPSKPRMANRSARAASMSRPGHRHLKIARTSGQPVAVLDDSPPVHFCKPSVDVLFSSAAEVFGGSVLGVVLTGMGTDGTRGSADIVAAGGGIIGQDEPTSIVLGYAGGGSRRPDYAALFLPLPDIAPAIVGRIREAGVTGADYEFIRKAAEAALRPDAVGREAIPGREPADAGGAGANGIADLSELTRKLRRGTDAALITEVVEAMTTNETFFFRDRIPFEHFRTFIMPALMQARARYKRIRIWCAAASTGQEAVFAGDGDPGDGRGARRFPD